MNGLIPRDELDEIHIENLEVRCVVGIYPREKLVSQPVIVNLRLFLDTRAAGRQINLKESIDYAAVAGEIRFVLEHSHFRLLETAADALSHLLLAPATRDQLRARPEAIELELRKPSALGGGAIAGVKVRRRRDEVQPVISRIPIGNLEILHQSADCVLYRLIVEAGEKTPAFYQVEGEVAEMALSAGLFVQGRGLGAGESHVWPQMCPRRYENPTRLDRAILCVARGGLDHFAAQVDTSAVTTHIAVPRHQMYYPGAEESATGYEWN